VRRQGSPSFGDGLSLIESLPPFLNDELERTVATFDYQDATLPICAFEDLRNLN
jgi:hypothetical protein